jgi:hypothetical protein
VGSNPSERATKINGLCVFLSGSVSQKSSWEAYGKQGRAMRYKDYVIEILETSPKRWRALVRRLDGQKIKIFVPEKEVESITTSGMESLTADDAVQLAKEMIDGGGMQ